MRTRTYTHTNMNECIFTRHTRKLTHAHTSKYTFAQANAYTSANAQHTMHIEIRLYAHTYIAVINVHNAFLYT